MAEEIESFCRDCEYYDWFMEWCKEFAIEKDICAKICGCFKEKVIVRLEY